MSRWPLGAVDIVFGAVPFPEAARRAAELGFDHLDLLGSWSGDVATLPIPIGDRMATAPRDGWSMPAPLPGPGVWEELVAALRRHPGVRLEPWVGSVCGSTDAVNALRAQVPGLRLLVDTGHVTCWGGDPVELLPWADHVQLRQAAPSRQQLMPEEGDVDFRALFAALDHLGYKGRLRIEYFDPPSLGWGLEDPAAYAAALAAYVRPMLA